MQQRDESAGDLRRRVSARIGALENQGKVPHRAALVCNDRSGQSALSARSGLARLLLAAMVRGGLGLLVLAADEWSAARPALAALAETLNESLQGTDVVVRLRIDRAEPRPLVRAVRRPIGLRTDAPVVLDSRVA